MKKIIASLTGVCLVFVLAIVPASAQSINYKCKPGDSLSAICKKYQISLKELKKCNPQIKNPSQIKAGQSVNIPESAPLQSLEDKVIELVNKERVSRNLMKLTKNNTASYVARLKSQDMINKNYFAHNSPTYGSPFKMMESYGLKFSAAGENIAYGQKTPEEVMKAWMNSAGHRANILSKNYTQIGVGAAKKSNGTLYWTQEFLKPIQ
ncbi:MAG: hypothetical protein BGN88_03950 [Clostridiales bacterium 43-6]|nr:MAG: hypothetical protein BGN88_03950 [Clostridiales bacterium 43-6]